MGSASDAHHVFKGLAMDKQAIRVGGFVVVWLSALAVSVPAAALDEAALRTAQNNIKNAEYDLQSAKGSAGTAANPAKGSRLKLTKMRLESAAARLDTAAEALGNLPAEGEQVTPLRDRHAAAVEQLRAIEAIISGGAAPPAAPRPAETPTQPAAPTRPATPDAPKLDYKQEKALKDANWYFREVDKYAAAAAAIAQRLDGQGEPVVHADVKAGLASLGRAWEKHTLVEERLSQLPADHPQVKPSIDLAAQNKAALGALGSRLQAADAELDKLTNMTHYPRFEADFEKVGELTGRYYDFRMTVQQPEKMAAVISEDAAVLAEIQRIAQAYLPLVQQRTEPGERMEKRFAYFMEKRTAFAGELTAYKAQLPAQFQADLDEGLRLAAQGVAEKKPMFFGPHSGIDQRFGWAEQKLLVLRAFDAEAAKPYEQKLADARAKVKQMARTLEADIIAQNTLPPDRYQGADRKDLIARAAAAWLEAQPKAKVLTATIASEAWERDTRWRHSGGGEFYKIDSSSLQVQLIVKHDGELAVIRPVNLYKNHLKNDTIKAFPMDNPDDELVPSRFIPLAKVK